MRCHNLASLQQSFMNDPHVTACPPSPLASPLDHLSPPEVACVSGFRCKACVHLECSQHSPSPESSCAGLYTTSALTLGLCVAAWPWKVIATPLRTAP